MDDTSPVAGAVGNDVVDLSAPRARGRADDPRFLARVFTAAERDAIRRSVAPDLEVWHAWGAKEAAYKVVSRALDPPPPFVHRAFEVAWDEPLSPGPNVDRDRAGADSLAEGRRGRVRHGEATVSVWARVPDGGALEVIALPGAVRYPSSVRVRHAVDRLERPGAPWNRPLGELRALMSDRECETVRSLPSAAVRLAAREAATRLLGVEAGRIEVVCRPGPLGRRPPFVLLDGEPAPVGISLSHDGPWIAWALLPFSTSSA